MQVEPQEGDTIAVWFSCGAASAVAAKLTLERYGNLCDVRVVNNPVAEEDEDNRRFLADVQAWLGVPIEDARNAKYPNASAVEVWDKRGAMSFPRGAPCTTALKKEARQQWERANIPGDPCGPGIWHVLGFGAEEADRFRMFTRTERANTLPILIDARMTRQDCYEYIVNAGLQPPRIYELGYPNANCIGCVKATSPTYWNHVRKVHPEVFASRAEQSRRLGAKLVRVNNERIYLDELDPHSMGKPLASLQMPECGLFCEEPVRAALDVVEASLGLHQPPAEQVGSLIKRALALAPSAGLYLSVKIEPAKAGRKPTEEEAERADMHSDLRRASRDD